MDQVIPRKPLFRKRVFWLGVAGLVTVLTLVSLALTSGPGVYRISKERVTIAEVRMNAFQEFIPVSGAVLPEKTVYLDAIQGGQIAHKFVDEGALVRAGDKIVRLSNQTVELNAVQQQSLTHQQINAYQNTRFLIEQNSLNLRTREQDILYNLHRSEKNLERQRSLWQLKLLSDSDYEAAVDEQVNYMILARLIRQSVVKDSTVTQSQLEHISHALDQLQHNLILIAQTIETLTIKAPVSGRVTSLDVELGESRAVGERIGQIDVLGGYRIRAAVDEFYLARVNIGLGASFHFDGRTHRVQVSKIYSEVKNGQFEVDLDFMDSIPSGMRRGLSLQIQLELGALETKLTVPRGAFYQKTGGNWIFVLETGSRATRRTIALGRQNPVALEVTDGLSAGERVIVSNYDPFGEATVIEIE